jgi:hypothetical protein
MLTKVTDFDIIVKVGARRWQTKSKPAELVLLHLQINELNFASEISKWSLKTKQYNEASKLILLSRFKRLLKSQ